MDEPDRPDAEPLDHKAALLTARILWLAFLTGQVVFAGVAFFLVSESSPDHASPGLGRLLTLISLGLLATATPLAYFLRSQTYKAHWQTDAVTPGGFVKANVLFFALLEAPAVLSGVAAILGGVAMPNLVPLLCAVAIQLINFPHGRPMNPAEPRLGVSER